MIRKERITKIDAVMDSVLAAHGYRSLCLEHQIGHRWKQIVGERMAGECEFGGVENGVLYVRVRSSAWRQEISFFKQEILSQIRVHTQCDTVSDIVFC
jgi:hypothetical protein